MQLVAQRSPKLLKALPYLLCCKLGGSVERLEACEDRHHVDALAAAMAACLPEVDMMGGSSSATEPAPGAESAAADAETARTTSSMRVCRGLEPSPCGSTWPRPRPPFPLSLTGRRSGPFVRCSRVCCVCLHPNRAAGTARAIAR